jgi:hypothetical protein
LRPGSFKIKNPGRKRPGYILMLLKNINSSNSFNAIFESTPAFSEVFSKVCFEFEEKPRT